MSKLRGIERIHFIGAGGISMSALAKLMLLEGKKVTGSDLTYSQEVVTLNQWGADVEIGHNPKRLDGADLVVYTAAVPETDPELCYAREMGIPTVMRHHFLQAVASEYEIVIAVAGTHGKTTTTGMIAAILQAADAPFTAHIGGHVAGVGNLVHAGRRFFVTEACEYKKSLLALHTDIAVVLNVEPDHPDTYPTLESLHDTFLEFIRGVGEKGVAVICAETEFYHKHTFADVQVKSYGYEGNLTLTVSDLKEHKRGCFRFLIHEEGNPEQEILLNVPGHHNVLNASAAYAAARAAGISPGAAALGLERFKGIERRFEARGEVNGAAVFLDYAHHPSEIAAVISTARSLAPRRLHVVFQPHTYSRTAQLYDAFIRELSEADKLYIVKEYPARELPQAGRSARELYAGFRAAGKDCVYYYEPLLPLAANLQETLRPGDILLILGAGDIATLADILEKDSV